MSGGTGREEEAEDLRKAGGPGGFVVEGVGDAEVGEVRLGCLGGAVAPAALEEAAVEEVGVAEVAEAFGGSHVEPDAEAGFRTGSSYAVEDGALVPPHAGGEDGGLAEDVGVVEGDGEGDEASERRPSDGGVGGVREGAKGVVDEGLEFLDQETAVAAAVATAAAWIAGVGVLGHTANAGVVDADEEDGLDFTGAGEGVCGGVGLPGAVGNEGGAAVDEVLAVVQIEDGEAAGWGCEIRFGEVDNDVAAGREEARAEALQAQKTPVFVELAGLVFAGGERLEGVVGSLEFRIVEQGRGLRVDCR